MIYYVSRQHSVRHEEIIQVDNRNHAFSVFRSLFPVTEPLALDTETTGLDAYENELLLISIGNAEHQFVFDWTAIPYDILREYKFVLHNAKFDYKFIKIWTGVEIEIVHDTMIADQIVYRGLHFNPQTNSGIKFALTELAMRYLKHIPEKMDKDTRAEFVNTTQSNWVPTPKAILYSAGDVEHLLKIADNQRPQIERYNLQKHFTEVTFPLISVIGDMELEGFTLSETKLRSNINKNKDIAFEKAVQLDKLMLERRNAKYSPNQIEFQYLNGGVYTNTRHRQVLPVTMGLFGELTHDEFFKKGKAPVKLIENPNNVNWGSDTQVVFICAALGYELPTTSKEVPYHKPVLRQYKKNGTVSIAVDESYYQYTTEKKALLQMLTERPDSESANFIKTLLEYREAVHEINAFGENFLKKLNSKTGKIHSIFRTETADNGRLQSGGGKREPKYINFQNIPAKNSIRNCFEVDNTKYSLTIADLSGAEVTIMCDKSNDRQLYEWAVKNDDAHSPIATSCWRAVYLYRAGLYLNLWNSAKEFIGRDNAIDRALACTDDELVSQLYELSQTFTISKSQNLDKRKPFKPITFGVVYNMHAKKCAKALGVTIDEAKVIIHTIESSIPATFNYVKGQAVHAIKYGYVNVDNRSNTRIWFAEVIKVLQNKRSPLEFKEQTDVEAAARNLTISGTQACMLKEAKVEISKYIKYHDIDANILNQIHDELVVRQPRSMDGVNGTETVLWYSDEAKQILQPDKPLTFPVSRDVDCDTINTLILQGKIHRVHFPEFVQRTMIEAANRYLTHFKMGSSVEVSDCWRK